MERDPAGWAAFAGYPGVAAAVIDADVSTVSAASDKVIRVSADPPWLLDVNFQCGPDESLPRRTHLYNTLLGYRHGLPMHSVVVLLSPRANRSNLTGVYEEAVGLEAPYLTFGYQVVRVWDLPADVLLSAGLGCCRPRRWGKCRRTSCPRW